MIFVKKKKKEKISSVDTVAFFPYKNKSNYCVVTAHVTFSLIDQVIQSVRKNAVTTFFLLDILLHSIRNKILLSTSSPRLCSTD